MGTREIVCGQYHGAPLIAVQIAEDLFGAPNAVSVHVIPRLVEKQHFRLQDKGACQGHSLGFSTGERAGVSVLESLQSYEIQSLEGMQAIGEHPRQFGKVRHTIIREGRRYWVVDGNIHFGMMPTHSTRVLLLDANPVALKVDGIVRMTEVPRVLPLPQAFQGDERNWYVGLALVDEIVVPVVSPEAFLSHYDLMALEQSSPTRVADVVRVMA